jgi:hypothetical protein
VNQDYATMSVIANVQLDKALTYCVILLAASKICAESLESATSYPNQKPEFEFLARTASLILDG